MGGGVVGICNGGWFVKVFAITQWVRHIKISRDKCKFKSKIWLKMKFRELNYLVDKKEDIK